MSLPGRCMGCGAAVIYTGRRYILTMRDAYWRDPDGRPHACSDIRPTCGAWMPLVEERCARRPGHGFEHRTAYAMENARRKGAA